MSAKYMVWVKASPDYESQFSILEVLCSDGETRYG
jgi:hypothetical protein